ncbi:g568 [Coccomyxa viridis]|uniref:G568 protein n=1 Tax=Coccomyxa viridis TaxID=1274662 RepID=A0ABP1FMT7_9CHLO
MLAFAKIAVLVLLAILAFALSSEGRELLDYYGDCWGGYRGWDWNRGDYWCQGRRWRRDGGWWDGGAWRYGGGCCITRGNHI